MRLRRALPQKLRGNQTVCCRTFEQERATYLATRCTVKACCVRGHGSFMFHERIAATARLCNVANSFEREENNLAAEARQVQREKKQMEHLVARLLDLPDDKAV